MAQAHCNRNGQDQTGRSARVIVAANPVSEEQFVASRRHQVPLVQRMSNGAWSIPVPMPIPSLPYVLVYALELDDGVALIDSGWIDDVAWSGLRDGLRQAKHDIADVRAVLLTHGHRDHYGLAARVRDASGAWIGMHAEDATFHEHRIQMLRDRGWLANCGVPDREIKKMVGRPSRGPLLDPVPEIDRLLDDGEQIDLGGRVLTAIWTPGHSPGHLCYFDEADARLYSGDHILPRISPIVSTLSADADPLSIYLQSLDKVAGLPVTEVLPAHEYRFVGLRERADALRLHHVERLEEVATAITDRPGSTTWELASRLHWAHGWDEMALPDRRVALGETLSHISLLRHRRRVSELSVAPTRWGDQR